MSTSGRYQSKLLGFLSRQSLRFQDKSGEALRHVKIAAVWGAQILLYPIYAGFQATRLVGKQLRQAARQVLPQLQAVKQAIHAPDASSDAASAPIADTPIQNTLQTLQTFALSLPADRLALQIDPKDAESPGVLVVVGTSALAQSVPETDKVGLSVVGAGTELVSSPSGSSSMQIHGVASLLKNRKLVLVTIENQSLDVLTSEQQHQLQRRMIWEIANYWRQQRVLGNAEAPLQQPVWVNSFLPLPKERANALPPIKAFQGLMAWMQVSPVATAVNLFQESKLTLALADQPHLAALPAAGQPLRSAQTSWQTLEERFRTLLKSWFDRPNSSLDLTSASGLPPQVAGSDSEIDAALADRSSQPALQPWSSRLMSWLFEEPNALPDVNAGAESQPSPEASRKPWLTLEDLFRNSRRTIVASLSSLQSAIAPTTKPASTDWELQDTALMEARMKTGLAGNTAAGQAQTARSPLEKFGQQSQRSAAIDTENPVLAYSTQSFGAGAIATSLSEPDQSLVSNPSWIETEAKLVAYEKHPLEQLLEWLDQGMVWVEGKLARFWQWMHDRWRA